MPTAGRRPLDFATLDQVMDDVDRLMAGYDRVGQWSLGQICKHLGLSLIESTRPHVGGAPWILRKTVGRLILRSVMRRRRLMERAPIPALVRPPVDLDERAEVEALRGALRAYSRHTGTMAVHPFLDRLTRAEWDTFHAIHCAHHLSFLRPTPPTPTET